MNLMLIGAIALANFIASLFFYKFWRSTHDRFFFLFALAFGVEGCGRVLLGLVQPSDEYEPLVYLVRLMVFMTILYAIIDKNTVKRRKEKDNAN